MQIIWVSGPVGRIRKVNLTFIHLIAGFSLAALLLVLIGVGLQYFGFRMAIEYDPQLAKQLGNLHSPVELENLTAFYNLKLLEVNKHLEVNQEKIDELQKSNKKLEVLATPLIIRDSSPKQTSLGGKFIPVDGLDKSRPLKSFSDLLNMMKAQEEYLDSAIKNSMSYIQWLESKPIGVPVKGAFGLSSGYGIRVDPFNMRQGFHTGLDFQSAVGTPIMASAQGKVVKSNFDASYGRLIVIDHGDGYLSRYAHAQEIYVHDGDLVKRNQIIGLIGTSGRSTGPHLHFEILKNGETIDPKAMLVSLSK